MSSAMKNRSASRFSVPGTVFEVDLVRRGLTRFLQHQETRGGGDPRRLSEAPRIVIDDNENVRLPDKGDMDNADVALRYVQ